MNYISRAMESKFLRSSDFFKVVLLSGARQVGKTTMLRHLATNTGRQFVSLDDPTDRLMAQEDPHAFFQIYPPPVLIDEIQYAPQLFPMIKVLADASEKRGQFWMTGSQHYLTMKGVQESLAGRIGLLEMESLSLLEVEQAATELPPDFTLGNWLKKSGRLPLLAAPEVFSRIWIGGMPAVQGATKEQRDLFFRSYIDSYLLRDVTELGNVQRLADFRTFLAATAALVGQQVNYSTLAEVSSIDQTTAKSWLHLLAGLGIVRLLAPYTSNALKRLARTPKLYFSDTGLAAYLCGWPNPETLMRGPTSGAFFENHVVLEFIKLYGASEETARFSYFRDHNAKEIDLLIDVNGITHPIEIKQSASPDRRQVRKFDVLSKTASQRGPGGIVCLSQKVYPLAEKEYAIPVSLI